jgi:hypothetical protein
MQLKQLKERNHNDIRITNRYRCPSFTGRQGMHNSINIIVLKKS